MGSPDSEESVKDEPVPVVDLLSTRIDLPKRFTFVPERPGKLVAWEPTVSPPLEMNHAP